MISEFTSKRKLFSFPKKWANAVARWISGIHSETGTIKITNTLSPSEEGSASFDVDMAAVVSRVEKRFGFDRESPMTRTKVRDIVLDLADGASILPQGRRLSVNTYWLDQRIQEQMGDGNGINVTNLVVYQLYKPDGTSHYWAVPYTLTFSNGLLTGCVAGTAFDLYTTSSANVPTIS